MSVFERLKLKILNDTGIALEDFRRLAASLDMRSSGAFIWTAKEIGSFRDAGSGETATNLLKLKKISIVDEYGMVIEFS